MKERLSAVMDGDTGVSGSSELIQRVGGDSELDEHWHAYCLIGDALRGEKSLASDFVPRVMEALEKEPTVLAPVSPSKRHGGRANRWMAVAASVMGVAVVGWMALTVNQDATEPSRAVQAVASVKQPTKVVQPVSATADVVDAHREYLFIHQVSTHSGQIPGVARYVRSVSEVGTGGAR